MKIGFNHTIASANETIGQRALTSNECRERTAVALEETVCLSLKKFEYDEKVFNIEH